MADFDRAVEKLLAAEGGFAARDNTAGAVNFGITKRFLQLIGRPASVEDVRALTREQAVALYREYFWDRLRIGELRDQRLAEAAFFAVVNMGPQLPARYLQESLRELRRPVAVDGIIGPQTIRELNALGPNETKALLVSFKVKLVARYQELARKNPAEYGDDLAGWRARLETV
jgi:lysozyme family protein